MAKKKEAAAEVVADVAEAIEVVRCVVAINEYSAYLGELKTEDKRSIIKRFLFYDPEIVESRAEKVRLRNLAGECDVVAKPGDILELPKAEFDFLERPGAVRRVK